MPTATLTRKGQITVPKGIREALGVSPGDKLVLRRANDESIVIEAATTDFRSLAGMLWPRRRRARPAQIQNAIRNDWAGR